MVTTVLSKLVGILPKRLQDLYYKYEDACLYIFFGALTTLVSLGTQYLAAFLITRQGYDVQDGIPNVICTTFSWICAVTFAFFTNKKYVFKSETDTKSGFWKQFFAFYGARGVSYFLEIGIMLLFATVLRLNYYLVKFGAQFLILAINYVFSKLVVFKKKPEDSKPA